MRIPGLNLQWKPLPGDAPAALGCRRGMAVDGSRAARARRRRAPGGPVGRRPPRPRRGRGRVLRLRGLRGEGRARDRGAPGAGLGALVPRPLGALSRGRAHAARALRPAGHRGGGRGRHAPLAAARRLARGRVPAAPRLRSREAPGQRACRLRLRARRGRRRARDPRGPHPRRHHRAGPLPLLHRRREGASPRGAAGLRAQGHRQALRGVHGGGGLPPRRARVGGFHRRLRVGLLRRRPSRSWAWCRRPGRAGSGRCSWSASASPTTWATWGRWATTRPSASRSPSSCASRRTGFARAPRCSATACSWTSWCPGASRAPSRRPMPSAWWRTRTGSRSEVRELRAIYEEHAGLQDRFLTTGRVTPDLARKLGLAGLGGRASGQAERPARGLPRRALRRARGEEGGGGRRRRGRARGRALRGAARVAAARARDRDGRAGRRAARRAPEAAAAGLRRRLGGGLAGRGASSPSRPAWTA